jgi:hypothetical protein
MKKVPSFKSEKAEREFWARHDSTEYVDWSRTRGMPFPKLQSSVRTRIECEQGVVPKEGGPRAGGSRK